MKILIIGANGMIGNGIFTYLSRNHDVFGTLKGSLADYKMPSTRNIFSGIDLKDISSINNIIEDLNPEVLINCSGIIKQKSKYYSDEEHIYLNSQIPNILADICTTRNVRLVNFSTDCVFNGGEGFYNEDHKPNADDIYGMSKANGEIKRKGCLTIRTSTIGLELENKHGLIEWFLSQNGKTVYGYDNAIYSGLTTTELARYLEYILIKFPDLSGLYQMAASKISKHELLSILSAKLKYCTINIKKNTDFICDRSLDGSHLNLITNFKISSWDDMLDRLADQINKRQKNEQHLSR